ncbi:hypothetical protein MUG91_G232n64 [Manis pentadactyla]|nr:hypothetical protein MUG91_G232n63 [Manis pentadactyla]KAI5229998.1 hypothetical protein MUG91_G232n64 [Manis pentadactyla]
MPRMKRKKNQPELSQENFKKHRSTLGMHLLEPVQVSHAPGKAADKETRFSSSQALGNSRNPKDPQPPPASKPWLNTPHDGKGLGKTHARARKPDGSVKRECPSPSQDERPPPGKNIISHFPPAGAPSHCCAPARASTQASNPASTPRTLLPTPSMEETQYFWTTHVKAHHPEEQRPEREAMKRRAQREREDAAKYTCAGKLQFFVGREKEMGTADYYGYVM